MNYYRHDVRIDCEEKCLLRHQDSCYPVTVKNISFGGALAHTYKPLQKLAVGDSCIVSMIGEFLQEYSCEVKRVEPANIALEFNSRHIVRAFGS